MTIIRDEQIIAAIYVMTGWHQFVQSFMEACYAKIYNGLMSLKIAWVHDSSKKWWHVADEYPHYFRYDDAEQVLHCTTPAEISFQAFLATLPDSTKKLMATVIREELQLQTEATNNG